MSNDECRMMNVEGKREIKRHCKNEHAHVNVKTNQSSRSGGLDVCETSDDLFENGDASKECGFVDELVVVVEEDRGVVHW